MPRRKKDPRIKKKDYIVLCLDPLGKRKWEKVQEICIDKYSPLKEPSQVFEALIDFFLTHYESHGFWKMLFEAQAEMMKRLEAEKTDPERDLPLFQTRARKKKEAAVDEILSN